MLLARAALAAVRVTGARPLTSTADAGDRLKELVREREKCVCEPTKQGERERERVGTTPPPPFLHHQLAFARPPPLAPAAADARARDAAATLGAFFGVSLAPGDVLQADAGAVEALLRATSVLDGGAQTVATLDPALDAALFDHADGVTRRFFGDNVYMRGIVEFSNV